MKKTLFLAACLLLVQLGCSKQESDVETYGDVADPASSGSNSDTAVGTPGRAGMERAGGSSNSGDDAAVVRSPGALSAIPTPTDPQAGIIKRSTTMSVTDRALMTRVRNNLSGLTDSQGTLSSQTLANLQISAERGIVTLRGSVSNDSEKLIIADRVQRMDGVVVVKNEMQVVGAPAIGGPTQNESGAARQNSASTNAEGAVDE